MAYVEIGADYVLNTANFGNYTVIAINKPGGGSVALTGNGTLKYVQIRVAQTGTVRLKVFRDDGSNFVYIGGDTVDQPVVLGINILHTYIPGVRIGDLMGVYFSAVLTGDFGENAGPGDSRSRVGNIVTTSAKAIWDTNTWRMAWIGRVFTRVGPLYVA